MLNAVTSQKVLKMYITSTSETVYIVNYIRKHGAPILMLFISEECHSTICHDHIFPKESPGDIVKILQPILTFMILVYVVD